MEDQQTTMQNGDGVEVKNLTLGDKETKRTIRLKIWRHMQSNRLALFPRPIYNRIPNFKGSSEAADKLAELDIFKNAKSIKINSDKPQEKLRMACLDQGKQLYVSSSYQNGYITVVSPPEDKKTITRLVTRKGMETNGKALDIGDKVELELVILGSVAVSKDGQRIGKGRGADDLELGILTHLKAITPNTLIITTVHDCQVFDAFQDTLMAPHDFPVDMIVTPTQVIDCGKKHQRPDGLLWNLLTQRRLELVPVLEKIYNEEIENGATIVLREPIPEKSPKAIRKRRTRFRSAEEAEKPESERKPRRPRPEIDFTIKVSNIKQSTRVRDVKKSLVDLGVKPQLMVWKGYKGFCLLHYLKPSPNKGSGDADPTMQSVLDVLKNLSISESGETDGDYVPVVEPAPPRKPKENIHVESQEQTTV